MRSNSHPVSQTPTSHEAIPHVERMFTQFSGGRYFTMEDPND
jgi:hypothetical protein